MSAPEIAIKLSPKARRDFIDILRDTGEKWGMRQLEVYRDKIDSALRQLSKNPDIGRHREDLPDTHRGYLVGEHIIVYRVQNETLGIVRILHQRMSLMQHLPKP